MFYPNILYIWPNYIRVRNTPLSWTDIKFQTAHTVSHFLLLLSENFQTISYLCSHKISNSICQSHVPYSFCNGLENIKLKTDNFTRNNTHNQFWNSIFTFNIFCYLQNILDFNFQAKSYLNNTCISKS